MKSFVLPSGKQALRDCLNNLPQGKYYVTVDELKPQRSHEQNARYWSILTHIAEQLPDENGRMYSPEVWHEYMKAQFIGKDTIVMDGNPELIVKSSAKLKVMEFAEYMTQVEAWGIDHGVRYWSDLGETG